MESERIMHAAAVDVAVCALALSAHLALAIRHFVDLGDGSSFAAVELSQSECVSVIVAAAELCAQLRSLCSLFRIEPELFDAAHSDAAQRHGEPSAVDPAQSQAHLQGRRARKGGGDQSGHY